MHRLVVALTALLVLSGAAVVAFTLLLAGAGIDRAAALAPADTAVYVNVYLQPSSGQRARLEALASRLPGFADAASLDDKIDQVTQNLLGQVGIDYGRSIKPWLGTQVAFAAGAGGLDAAQPLGVVMAAVRDRPAAEAALADLAPGADGETYEGNTVYVGAESTYALLDEMLVIGSTRAEVEKVIDVSGGAAALADAATFREAIDRLPADRLATIYLDLARLSDQSGRGGQGVAGLAVLSAAVVLENDGVRLTGSAPFDAGEAGEAARAAFDLADEPSSLVDWMAADTQAEVVLFGARQVLEVAESVAATAPGGDAATDALSALRTLAAFGLGIDLDSDVLPLFDREVALAASGLDTAAPRGQLLARPSDPDEAAALLERLTQRLEASGATVSMEDRGRVEVTLIELPAVGTIAYTLVDGVAIVGLSADDVEAAVSAHDSGQTLSGTDAYRRAFELADDRAGNEAWLDVAAVLELTGVADAFGQDARDILDQITAFGLTAPARDDAIQFRAVVTVD